MSEKAVEKTFEALFALTDLRQIFRETKPLYELTDGQRKQLKEILEKVRKNLEEIEKEMAK